MLDIEVGLSTENYAEAEGLRIDPHRHEVLPDGDYIKGLRRHVNLPQLFIYRHRETRAFVLAGWLIEGRVCTELFTWHGGRLTEGAPTYKQVELQTRPVREQARERVEMIRDTRRRTREGAAASEDERQRQIRKARMKGDDARALSLMTSPFVTRDEDPREFDESINKLKEATWDATPKAAVDGLKGS